MFCQWCGHGRDPDGLAIHHCGATDRPPAYCMQCGQALQQGASACASCGLAAGEKPVPVAAGVRATTAAAAAQGVPTSAPAQPAVAGGARAMPVAKPAAPEQKHAPAVSAVRHDARGRMLRQGALGAAIAGVCSFFIPWSAGPLGLAGITVVERTGWSWWTPPCAQLLFIGFLTATAIGALAYRSTSNFVDLAMSVIGVGLVIALGRWLWLTRHAFDSVTGFWLTVGAGFVLAGFAIASALHDRTTG